MGTKRGTPQERNGHCLQPELEKANLLPPRPELHGGAEDGSDTSGARRPADVWVPHWNLHGPAAFDLAVTSGLRQGHCFCG